MPRKGKVQQREILPDPIYNSKLVSKLINHLMLDGKRGTASEILYGAFDEIKDETGNDPVEVFEEAMKNVMPVLEVKARRWWVKLPGSDRSSPSATHNFGTPLAS